MTSTLYRKREVPDVGRNRKKRPRTFKTEELAKKWADENNISNYELFNLKSPDCKKKKIRIVAKK